MEKIKERRERERGKFPPQPYPQLVSPRAYQYLVNHSCFTSTYSKVNTSYRPFIRTSCFFCISTAHRFFLAVYFYYFCFFFYFILFFLKLNFILRKIELVFSRAEKSVMVIFFFFFASKFSRLFIFKFYYSRTFISEKSYRERNIMLIIIEFKKIFFSFFGWKGSNLRWAESDCYG